MKKKRLTDKLNEVLEVPRELNSDDIKITVISFDEMLIENYKGILEYEEFYLKIKTEIGLININGFNLGVEEITSDDIIVKRKNRKFGY
jgi:sporulation protein YqfC